MCHPITNATKLSPDVHQINYLAPTCTLTPILHSFFLEIPTCACLKLPISVNMSHLYNAPPHHAIKIPLTLAILNPTLLNTSGEKGLKINVVLYIRSNISKSVCARFDIIGRITQTRYLGRSSCCIILKIDLEEGPPHKYSNAVEGRRGRLPPELSAVL